MTPAVGLVDRWKCCSFARPDTSAGRVQRIWIKAWHWTQSQHEGCFHPPMHEQCNLPSTLISFSTFPELGTSMCNAQAGRTGAAAIAAFGT